MSLQAVYNRFIKTLGRTLPDPISITWNSGNYLISNLPSYSGAVAIRTRTEQELRDELKGQGIDDKVIDKVVEILPQKKSVTLYPKSYITILPSPEHYSLIENWVILYDLGS